IAALGLAIREHHPHVRVLVEEPDTIRVTRRPAAIGQRTMPGVLDPDLNVAAPHVISPQPDATRMSLTSDRFRIFNIASYEKALLVVPGRTVASEWYQRPLPVMYHQPLSALTAAYVKRSALRQRMTSPASNLSAVLFFKALARALIAASFTIPPRFGPG